MNPNADTILIVDDTLTNLDILVRFLKRSGYNTLGARNGMDALALVRRTPPDIILLDVMMPKMDGFEVCRRLKADIETKDIPVIFMTALSDVESKVKAFEAGAADYVTKPVERREVLARLEHHLTLVKLQKQLENEIVERKKIEVALRRYTKELQNKNEELDAFAHTVAHDIKNPLGIIMGLAELLAEDPTYYPIEQVKQHLESVARNSRKAVNIVEELLVLSSVRQKEVEMAELNMLRIVEEAKKRLVNTISEHHAEIILPERWPPALGYAPWVEEVWVNYISNAIKYGDNPPIMELGGTEQEDGMVRFWVKDNGPGLTREEQQRLFTPFTRLKHVRAQGHGLGLSIARRIVEKLGGQVGVESEGIPGKGSIFSFTLPKVTPDVDYSSAHS